MMLNRQDILDLNPSEIVRWPVPKDLEEILSTTSREESVSKVMKSGDALAGAKLQNAATPDQINAILKSTSQSLGFSMLRGVGIELGAGVGMFSVVAANIQSVEKVLALELVPSFLEHAIPAAAEQLAGSNRSKIVPVYGSFEDLKIKDNQLDFVIQIESLHHAYNPIKAAEECFRVLRPGGQVFSIDRSHPNSTPDQVLEELLNHVYPKSWLQHHGYPLDKGMTRRDNGEHEYRDSQWKYFFESSGFITKQFQFFAPKITTRQAVKRLLEVILPNLITSRKIKIPARPRTFRTFIFQKLGFENSILGSLPSGKQARWQTLMIFEKPN